MLFASVELLSLKTSLGIARHCRHIKVYHLNSNTCWSYHIFPLCLLPACQDTAVTRAPGITLGHARCTETHCAETLPCWEGCIPAHGLCIALQAGEALACPLMSCMYLNLLCFLIFPILSVPHAQPCTHPAVPYSPPAPAVLVVCSPPPLFLL